MMTTPGQRNTWIRCAGLGAGSGIWDRSSELETGSPGSQEQFFPIETVNRSNI